jgi:nucleotide-binding universal stress UspA family protein
MREVVVGVDDSPASHVALRWAVRHAGLSRSALVAAHVWAVPVETEVELDPRTSAMLADELGASPAGMRTSALNGAPGPALVHRSHESALLVVGAQRHRHLDPRASVAAHCLHRSNIAVAVVPESCPSTETGGRRTVGVGVDLSPDSAAALRWAYEAARQRGADLDVGFAWQHSFVELARPVQSGARAGRHDADARLVEWARAVLGPSLHGGVRVAARHGSPLDMLVDLSVHAQLLVLGSHGHRRLARVLGGSVSAQLTLVCKCPVVVVPPVSSLATATPDATV